MNITVNGESRDIKNGCSVLDLVRALNLNPAVCEVQRNDDILMRDAFNETRLVESHVLEIVRLVEGG